MIVLTYPPLKAPTGFLTGNAAVGVSIILLVLWKPRALRMMLDVEERDSARAAEKVGSSLAAMVNDKYEFQVKVEK